MKTLKFFLVSGILAVLTFGNTNAQTPKEVTIWTDYFCEEDLIPCLGELVCGDLTFILTIHGSKYQLKISGTLIGQESQDVYTAHQIENSKSKEWTEGSAGNSTCPFTCIITKPGAPAVIFHGNFHYTINANGEMTASFDKNFARCY